MFGVKLELFEDKLDGGKLVVFIINNKLRREIDLLGMTAKELGAKRVKSTSKRKRSIN